MVAGERLEGVSELAIPDRSDDFSTERQNRDDVELFTVLIYIRVLSHCQRVRERLQL